MEKDQLTLISQLQVTAARSAADGIWAGVHVPYATQHATNKQSTTFSQCNSLTSPATWSSLAFVAKEDQGN